MSVISQVPPALQDNEEVSLLAVLWYYFFSHTVQVCKLIHLRRRFFQEINDARTVPVLSCFQLFRAHPDNLQDRDKTTVTVRGYPNPNIRHKIFVRRNTGLQTVCCYSPVARYLESFICCTCTKATRPNAVDMGIICGSSIITMCWMRDSDPSSGWCHDTWSPAHAMPFRVSLSTYRAKPLWPALHNNTQTRFLFLWQEDRKLADLQRGGQKLIMDHL